MDRALHCESHFASSERSAARNLSRLGREGGIFGFFCRGGSPPLLWRVAQAFLLALSCEGPVRFSFSPHSPLACPPSFGRATRHFRFATLEPCTETPPPAPAARCTVSRGAPSPDGPQGTFSSRERFGSRSLHWARTRAGPFLARRAAHHAPGSPRQNLPPSPGRQHPATRAPRLGS